MRRRRLAALLAGGLPGLARSYTFPKLWRRSLRQVTQKDIE